MGSKDWWKTPFGVPSWRGDPNHLPSPLTLRLKKVGGWLMVLIAPVNLAFYLARRDWVSAAVTVVLLLSGLHLVSEASQQQRRRVQEQGPTRT